ncbi:MAG: MMPL family transporter [Gammaproteobacteria bacterium]|nr:MMPL family transporter [Gammaproteobacteria bacterium]
MIDQLLSKRYLLAVATLLLGGIVVAGMQYSTLESTYTSILSEDDPYRAEVDQTKLDFPPSTSVLFVFQSEDDVFNFDALRAMDALTNRYDEIDSALAIGSLMNRRLNSVEAERYDRDYLVPDLTTLAQADLADIRSLALKDEELTKSLLAPDGDMALAVVKYKTNVDDQPTRLRVAESVLSLRDSLREQHPDVEIYALGGALFELEGYNAQIKDSQVLFPLVVGIGVVLLWFCLKSLSYSLGLFAIAFATVGLTVGTYGWAQISFNQISTLGPLVVLVIAIADGIHIVSVYKQGLHSNLSKLDAMRHSLTVNLQPVTLATITTSMGFLSLNYSSSPGIYGFGNIVAIGVCWAYVVTLTTLPALILLLPENKVAKPLGVQTFISVVGRLVEEKGNALFWGSGALIVLTLALLPLNNLDFDRYSFIDEDSDFHRVMTALREKIGNDQSLVYSVNSGEYYGITELAFLDQVDEFSLWLEDQPEASFVTSYTDLLRTLNKAEHDDDEAWNKLPDDKLQIIDYLVGYQLIQEIEPNLEPIFNADYSAIRLVIGTSSLSNLQIINFNDRIDSWIAENLNPEYEVLHGDNNILFARLDRNISVELMKGFTLSFVLITLTLLIGLRSLRYGLVSIMPNLFPATIVFGFWGFFVGELSPYILMLFSISIGLVVDDSVHILSKYIYARREGESPEQAVKYSLDKAGSAITITTLALAVGTFILVFSNTFHFQNVALLLTPIIVVALLLDLLFLPPLLIKFDSRSANKERAGASIEAFDRS